MSIDITAVIERARAAAAQKTAEPAGAHGASERGRLEKVAQEFESMLLTQVLRDMRKSGAWDDEDSEDTYGAETMYETLDVELAGHLAHVQGLGLSKQLLEAFDRMNAGRNVTPATASPEPASTTPTEGPRESVGSIGGHTGSPSPSGLREGLRETADKPGVAPVDGKVTSAFGWRHDPFTGQAKFHRGVDLRAAYGQDIGAAGEGRVVFSGQQGGYGTTVMIEHGDGTRTRYAHLSVALVAAGDSVGAGQPIGRAGRSGRVTGTHLHFEVIAANGQPLDPRAPRAVALRASAQNGGVSGD